MVICMYMYSECILINIGCGEILLNREVEVKLIKFIKRFIFFGSGFIVGGGIVR